MKRIIIGLMILSLFSCITSNYGTENFVPPEYKNVIILIGDGMGPEEVKAAGYYLGGSEGILSFEQFPHQAMVSTHLHGGGITDSAAAATAMATGVKVDKGILSMAVPGDGSDLYTLLEYFQDFQRSTGLVTTARITHATPAAFAAHNLNRDNEEEILEDYLEETRPNVLFGGGSLYSEPDVFMEAQYQLAEDETTMMDFSPQENEYYAAIFGGTHMPYLLEGQEAYEEVYPTLSEMAEKAVELLSADPDGFFLMIEGGRIDHAGHDHQIEKNLQETLEFHRTVQGIYDLYKDDPNTLILVTADHETGGLEVIENRGQGEYPMVTWSTTNHTSVNVPLYAFGKNAELFHGEMDNTDFFPIIAPRKE